ncbi:hypothetical protein WA026_003859 [Henosepilachna vigintioctopunctata]|uniref:Uncharacterized protein n=1 Tax=Henosepilachna vigintioctopunctata TaxID=420089 RepID=A0AAW1UI37_9CUCU
MCSSAFIKPLNTITGVEYMIKALLYNHIILSNALSCADKSLTVPLAHCPIVGEGLFECGSRFYECVKTGGSSSGALTPAGYCVVIRPAADLFLSRFGSGFC